jgi:ABC-type multidrug transport system fused ATPase/permease subunit
VYERYSFQCRHFSSQLKEEEREAEKEQKKTQAKIVKELLSHIWPSNQSDSKAIKLRVLASVGCLFGAKFVTISVPFLFKELIDSYGDISTATDMASASMYIPALVVGYGVARSASAGLQELRNTIFATVTQRAIRKVARDVFRHLHELDMKFHTNRNTGTLFRVIDRGSRSINFALTSILFNIVPTTFEVGLVSSILAVSHLTLYFAHSHLLFYQHDV